MKNLRTCRLHQRRLAPVVKFSLSFLRAPSIYITTKTTTLQKEIVNDYWCNRQQSFNLYIHIYVKLRTYNLGRNSKYLLKHISVRECTEEIIFIYNYNQFFFGGGGGPDSRIRCLITQVSHLLHAERSLVAKTKNHIYMYIYTQVNKKVNRCYVKIAFTFLFTLI